jgi:phospholipid/cholesterol/gamma-HCH transport system substrate-binding protein
VPPSRRRDSIRRLITFLALVAMAGGFSLWLLTLGGGLPTLSTTHYSVTAVLPYGGAQLVHGARVTMAGVQVGEVDSVSRRGGDAVVKMTIDHSGVTPLPVDSRAELRTRTPLGENYMEIHAGHRRSKMGSGAVIGVRQAAHTVDVDQVLSVLQGKAGIQARAMIQGLGGALHGRGDRLNELTGSAASTVQNGSQVIDALAPQREQISQLVQQLGDLTGGIGTEGSQIRELADGGLSTFRAIAARDEDLRRLIDVLPGTLEAVRTTTGKLGAVTGQVAPVLFNLATTIDAARPAAQLLAPATDNLRGVLAALNTAAPPLKQTLAQLERLSPSATHVLPEAHKLLCQANPIIRYAQPYTADILALFTEFGSASNTFDAIGHTMALDPTINEDAFVGQTPEMTKAIQTLLDSGLLSQSSHLTYDPYPAPNLANAVASRGTEVSGPGTLKAQTGYVYPHILADC